MEVLLCPIASAGIGHSRDEGMNSRPVGDPARMHLPNTSPNLNANLSLIVTPTLTLSTIVTLTLALILALTLGPNPSPNPNSSPDPNPIPGPSPSLTLPLPLPLSLALALPLALALALALPLTLTLALFLTPNPRKNQVQTSVVALSLTASAVKAREAQLKGGHRFMDFMQVRRMPLTHLRGVNPSLIRPLTWPSTPTPTHICPPHPHENIAISVTCIPTSNPCPTRTHSSP